MDKITHSDEDVKRNFKNNQADVRTYRYWKPLAKQSQWHLVPDTDQGLRDAISNGAAFVSWPTFSGNATPTDETRRQATVLIIDFDDKERPEKALLDARQLMTYHLVELYDFDPAWAHYYCSGKKGFHVEIPIDVFGKKAAAGHALLPLVFRLIVSDWKSRFGLDSLDASIYCMGKGRMWRLPNVQRSNERYKVELTADEFQFGKPDDLWFMADSPREQFDDVDEYPEIEPLPELVREFDAALGQVMAARRKRRAAPPLSDEQRAQIQGQVSPCIGHIISKLPEKNASVNFNRLTWLLVDYFQAAGFDLDRAIQYCEHFLNNYPHSDTYNTALKRNQEFEKIWHYCYRNGDTRFHCGLVKSLHLSGSAFECKKCDLENVFYDGNDGEITGNDSSLPMVTIEWESPVLLDDNQLTPLNVELMPPPLRDMVIAVAAYTETPPELAAVLGLGTLATTVQRKIVVETDPEHHETLSIFAIAAMRSGNRKSAVQRAMTAPLVEWERRHRSQTLPEREAAQLEYNRHKKRLNALENKYANCDDDAKREQYAADITALGLPPDPPTEPRIWADDITSEKLGQEMFDNNECMSLLSSEGGIFDIMSGGRYNGNTLNIDIYLKGHAGDYVRVDRGSRPAVDLDQAALTVALSPQPSVIQSIAKVSGFRGRGLLARFLYALPESLLGYRKLESRPIPPSVREEYGRVVKRLLDIPYQRDQYDAILSDVIHPDKQAYAEWKDFQRAVEIDIRPGNRFENIDDWASKLPGAAARIAAIFHCVIHADTSPWSVPLSLPTMSAALELAATLTHHGVAAFGLMKVDPQLEAATKVWRWVERNLANTFSEKEVFDSLRGTFQVMDNMKPAFAVLVERSYIRKLPPEKRKGRPSVKYEVNPYFSETWR